MNPLYVESQMFYAFGLLFIPFAEYPFIGFGVVLFFVKKIDVAGVRLVGSG